MCLGLNKSKYGQGMILNKFNRCVDPAAVKETVFAETLAEVQI